MKKNKFNNIIGLTLVEILIGIVVSMLMMGAMYTSYSIVNNTYSQVTSRATISRSGRDVVGMMMRDIRMAGFKYYGDTARYVPGNSISTLEKSHAPVIITKEKAAKTSGIIDSDLYNSYKVALKFFWPRLIKGGCLYLDEYFSFKYPGAKIACDEFFNENQLAEMNKKWEYLSVNDKNIKLTNKGFLFVDEITKELFV